MVIALIVIICLIILFRPRSLSSNERSIKSESSVKVKKSFTLKRKTLTEKKNLIKTKHSITQSQTTNVANKMENKKIIESIIDQDASSVIDIESNAIDRLMKSALSGKSSYMSSRVGDEEFSRAVAITSSTVSVPSKLKMNSSKISTKKSQKRFSKNKKLNKQSELKKTSLLSPQKSKKNNILKKLINYFPFSGKIPQKLKYKSKVKEKSKYKKMIKN